MWVLVLDSATGVVIKNATFSINWYNRGDGYYYVYFSQYNQAFTCGAPNYTTLWGNNDSYTSLTLWLAKPPPPTPPPSNCNCWT